MPRFRASRDSYGFQGKHWERGEEVTLDDGEEMPAHFEPVQDADSTAESDPSSEPRPSEKKRLKAKGA